MAFVLLEELFKNNDGYFLSHHLYTAADGKLRFVPWDLDLSLGQPIYNDNENPASWIAYRSDLIAGLGRSAAFQARLVSMWSEWRADVLADDVVVALLDANPTLLGDAIDRNVARWPLAEINFFSDQLTVVSSYAEELQRVQAFFVARLAFIDDNVATWSTPVP